MLVSGWRGNGIEYICNWTLDKLWFQKRPEGLGLNHFRYHLTVYFTCRDLNYNDLQEFPLAIRTLSKLQELWVCICTHIHENTPACMTIMVALSQVIPLSDFNVALGYNLSRPKQVLATHPRSRLPAHKHRCTRTYTQAVIFLCFSRCFVACIWVTDTVYVYVFTSRVSKNVFQLCNGRCNEDIWLASHSQAQTVTSPNTQNLIYIDGVSH